MVPLSIQLNTEVGENTIVNHAQHSSRAGPGKARKTTVPFIQHGKLTIHGALGRVHKIVLP